MNSVNGGWRKFSINWGKACVKYFTEKACVKYFTEGFVGDTFHVLSLVN